eukprot:CAMPEP_0196768198 /NCGR_PEP_ID=MMETSP1095-20130614/42460_1 /TAXON_ID=96789 ORGANISM="Chromulina nebulosa, Strain UTEXLB2642" /NCGR_SAMPLE_ID=MMETSP1095 /ASSEMBLY_ACC=CAM_ASM_000446 /LENGTH=93 /DNA_ID=CAMNT_0042137439 /DNA_START=365 /DNA_END=643 /DNA_ORIENTATION=+
MKSRDTIIADDKGFQMIHKVVNDQLTKKLNHDIDFTTNSISNYEDITEIDLGRTRKNLYFQFSVNYPGATVILEPTTNVMDDYLQSFEHLKDW